MHSELLAQQPEMPRLLTALEDLVRTRGATNPAASAGPPAIMISYNSKDRVAVERLRREIIRRRIRVWMDRAEPEIHTGSIHRVLAKILGTAQAFIVVRGPHGTGPYQRDEMDVILDEEKKRAVPVVVVVPESLVGAPPPQGPFWDHRSYIDLRDGDYDDHVRVILEALGISRSTS